MSHGKAETRQQSAERPPQNCRIRSANITLFYQSKARNHRRFISMGGEIVSTAILLFTLTLVGLGVGFLMLRLQGGEE
jgi:cytochrome b6-f complex subunit 7